MSNHPNKSSGTVEASERVTNWLGRYGPVLGRLIIGWLWITQLAWKMPPTFGCPPNFAASTSYAVRTTGLCDWTGLMAVYSLVPLHAAFVRDVVIPNLAWMGWLIWLMEVFIAATLILGVVSRLGAAVGIVQAVNLFIGLSAVPNEWYWSYGMLITLELIFFCLPPGRVLGIDAALRQRFGAADSKAPRWLKLALAWLS